MAGLLDLFGGDATQPGALYGGMLSPQQSSALGYRGLLAAAGALGQAAMPSRMPIPIGAALGQAAAAMGQGQDSAALEAMRAQLLGLQARELNLKYGMQREGMDQAHQIAVANGLLPGASPLTGASPGSGVSSPAPNASVNDNSGIGAGQLYGFLAQNGASPNEAAMLTSAANSESSFRPDITHDGGIGYGLFGHNTDRLAAMRQFAGVGPNDPVPWQKQALFALSELHGSESKAGAMVNSATTPEQLTDAQLAFERPNLNIAGGNRAQRLASTREYMTSPPGAKPVQLAQANTGTVSDANPYAGTTGMGTYIPPGGTQQLDIRTGQPAGAPQSLLPPQTPGSETLRVGGAGGLLPPPQPTTAPPTGGSLPTSGMAGVPQGLLDAARAAPTGAGPLPPQAMQAPQVAQAPMAPPAPPQASANGLDPYTRRMLGLEAMNIPLSIAGLGTPYQGMVGVLGGAPGYKGAQAAATANAENASKLQYAGPTALATKNAENTSDLNFAFPIGRARELAKIQDARQGSAGWQFNPTTGKYELAFQTPRLPEGMSLEQGPNGEPVAKAVPGVLPGITEAAAAQKTGEAQGNTLAQRNEVLKKEYEDNVVEPFNHAQVALAPLTALKNAMANYQTGPGAETKLNLLRAWQSFGQYAGIPQDSDLAKQIASGEIIKKEGTQLGFALARTLGSREAGQIVQQAIQTNPGLQNSPQGNTQLIGLIQQGLQRDIDKRSFVDKWFNKNLSYDGATDAFNKANPVEKYVSQILPFQPKTPAEAAQLPRGTRFVDPTGTVRTSPGPQQ